MTSVREALRRFFTPIRSLPPGVYHYQAPPDDPRNYRLHLRLEADGSGILIVNAATILHLNQTAAEYAYHLVTGSSNIQAARSVAARYRISAHQAMQDYRDFTERIDTLVSVPDLDPVTFLDFDRREPFAVQPSAPYRLDCALTYRLPSQADAAAAPSERARRELSTEEWEQILDKAWQAGIPHVVFTGGEPTLRADLPRLIAHAESNGQVSGLLSDGLRLAEAAYLEELLQTGLDHLSIVLQPEDEASWEAVQNALQEDLFTAVHLTITPQNSLQAGAILERLAGAGVSAVSLSAIAPGLASELQAARDRAAALGLTLVWDLPVPYSAFNPVALEVKEKGLPAGAGRAWLYVEPDGDVLPAQGVNRVLGNLLEEPWETIWRAASA